MAVSGRQPPRARVGYSRIPAPNPTVAYRPVSKVPIGKADGPHLGTENWLPNGRKGSTPDGSAPPYNRLRQPSHATASDPIAVVERAF